MLDAGRRTRTIPPALRPALQARARGCRFPGCVVAPRPGPPPPALGQWGADPLHALEAAHRAAGLAIHARTACPSWLGERLDLGWAIDVLHPAANPGAYRAAGRAP